MHAINAMMHCPKSAERDCDAQQATACKTFCFKPVLYNINIRWQLYPSTKTSRYSMKRQSEKASEERIKLTAEARAYCKTWYSTSSIQLVNRCDGSSGQSSPVESIIAFPADIGRYSTSRACSLQIGVVAEAHR